MPEIESARSAFPHFLDVTGAFEDQITYVRDSIGTSSEVILLPTFDGPSTGVSRIKRAISESSKPVVVFSHSKGGMSTLYTLLEYPELRAKVAGWVANSTPFRGKIQLEQLHSWGATRWASRRLAQGLGGHESIVEEFLPSSAGTLLSSQGLRELMVQVPTLSNGHSNDLAVPLAQGILPGSSFVELPWMPDHGSAVQGISIRGDRNLDRRNVTENLLLILAGMILNRESNN